MLQHTLAMLNANVRIFSLYEQALSRCSVGTVDARNLYPPTLFGSCGLDTGFQMASAMMEFENSYTTHVGYVSARTHTGTFLMGPQNFVTAVEPL